jgi:hypothetical protein
MVLPIESKDHFRKLTTGKRRRERRTKVERIEGSGVGKRVIKRRKDRIPQMIWGLGEKLRCT